MIRHTKICQTVFLLVLFLFFSKTYALDSNDKTRHLCQSLDGVYSFIGESYEQSKTDIEKPELPAIAFYKASMAGNVEAVHIIDDEEGKMLHIELLGNDLIRYLNRPITFSQKYDCINEQIVFVHNQDSYAEGMHIKASIRRTLWRDNEQSLIVHSIADIESTVLFIFKSRRRPESFYKFRVKEWEDSQ